MSEFLDNLKASRPELYEKLMRLGALDELGDTEADAASLYARMARDVDIPRGQEVGPYNVYVASSPLSRLAGGIQQGTNLGRMSKALQNRRDLAGEGAAGAYAAGSSARHGSSARVRNHAQRLRDRPRSGAEFPDGVQARRLAPGAARPQQHAGP
jgi:hypothetical protein